MDSPLGIDLAKLVFSIHGIDANDKCKLRKTVKRNNLLAEIAKLPPCIIAMEACSGAHYWAREFTKLGHDVRIMASKFVILYRQNEKNDAKHFETSRSFAAWVSLVPRQYSTGGGVRLGRISKRGEKHIRTSLIHGARAVIANCKNKTDQTRLWVKDLVERRGFKRATIALAAKNARLIWALLHSEKEYQVDYVK